MYSVSVENKDGNVLVLTGVEEKWQVISILGLAPAKAIVNTTNIAGMDGGVINSTKLETRNIVITLQITGDVETSRQELEDYFRTKQWCKFYYRNTNRNVYADGYVESFECDLFEQGQKAQISIICPYPYFIDMTEIATVISSVNGEFDMPWSIDENNPIPFSSYDYDRVTTIYNGSGSEIGEKIVINVLSGCSEILIRNIDTGESIVLDYAFQTGDVVTVNTRKGQKRITLTRSGVTTNIFSALQRYSVLFQLHTGNNPITFTVDSGTANDAVEVTFYYSAEYNGV